MNWKENMITVIGSLNYDIILKQQRMPNKGETYTVDSVTTGCGGKGANQAVQCSKMGVKTVMLGAIGNDLYGDFLYKQLKKYAVEVKYIKRTNESTGLGINNVLVDGSLFANIVRGANFTVSKEDIDRTEEQIAKSKIVILQLEIPTDVTEYAVSIASKHECYIILNVAPAKVITDTTFSKVNCLIFNENEASFYIGKPITNISSALGGCEELYKKIKNILVITLGEKGCLLFNGKDKIHVSARKVNVVDVTGAGDSYIGAFAAKLLNGTGIIEAAIFGNIAASITITKLGAQTSMPSIEEVQSILKKESLKVTYY